MKKAIVTLTGTCLLFLFLLYCGIFRNTRNPESIIRYYYDCVKNGEWFLTYQFYQPEHFDAGKIFNEYISRKFCQLERIVRIDNPGTSNGNAYYELELVYKNGDTLRGIAHLEFGDGKWLIVEIKHL